ncbi:MAG: DNA polymerase Y family protein [Candidatus Eremiobacteraeota bacterium]|nr:DNA polymerase Y family protein [Candidatus Eremiobacteraeota bacterium]
MIARRIACLLIPRFVADVCLRANPSLAGRPLAVAEGAQRRQIVAQNAMAAGVEPGMTPKQARAACPGLVVVARNEAAERSVTRELLDVLGSCSPHVEGAAPGRYFFDAGNLPHGEAEALAAALALARGLGFDAQGAIADDRFAAHCAAVSGGGCSIVPPGKSAAFLAPLPISLLPLAPGDADRFAILGLRTLGQIAALPGAPLAARFGERSRVYARLATGQDDTALAPRQTLQVYEERFAFDGAIDQLEPLLFALRGCLTALADRLSGAAHVCDRVEIVLVVDAGNNGLHCANGEAPQPVVQIPVLLAEPSASMSVMFDLARIALEPRDDLRAVEALIVRALPCAEPPPQLALFDGSGASRRLALAATLARLRAALHPGDVATLETQTDRSRLPERMQRVVPIGSPREFEERGNAARYAAVRRKTTRTGAVKKRSATNARPHAPVARVVAAAVAPVAPAHNGTTPCWAPALRLVDPPKPMSEPEKLRAFAGPFRLSESWWERPVERDYYQLLDANGALVLAYRDLRDDRWYLQGFFD